MCDLVATVALRSKPVPRPLLTAPYYRPLPQAEKEGPKMLDEYCRDLCADVRNNRIDPVRA